MNKPLRTVDLGGTRFVLWPMRKAKARALAAACRHASKTGDIGRHATLVIDAVYAAARKLQPSCTREYVAVAIDITNIARVLAAVLGSDGGDQWQQNFELKLAQRTAMNEGNEHGQ